MNAAPAEVRAAEAFLRELAMGFQSLTLYPPGHPRRVELGTSLADHARALVDAASPGEPTIFVDETGYYVGTTLLVHESLTLGRLIVAFGEAGVESLTIHPGPAAPDFEGLLEVLRGERERPQALGAIRINAVRVTRPTEEAWQERLTHLRRAYATGVGVLKDVAGGAASGRPLNLEATMAVVEQLASEVARDPGYGLLLSAVRSYDEYTYFHMVNVCLMSVALGQAIGLRQDQVHMLGLGGLLIDIGNVYVPQEILSHPGRLDEDQWRYIRRHPIDGAGLVLGGGADLYRPAVAIVLEHHAGYESGGYPHLHGHRPSVPSRLVAVADRFDAMTSKRPYRDALDRHEAMWILEAAAGRSLDPDAVRVFEQLVGDFPIGALVRLDTGEVGVVVRQHEHLRDRPTVLVVLDRAGAPAEVEERDLSREGGGTITARLDVRDVGLDLTRFVVSGQVEPATLAPR